MFAVGFEGLVSTKSGVAAVPIQIGIIDIGTRQRFEGSFRYEHASLYDMVQDINRKDMCDRTLDPKTSLRRVYRKHPFASRNAVRTQNGNCKAWL